mmetsp:Transcript_72424/g.132255  ORF Transcript_72424/g.132255 Transcript_72424/m.132255 type:complete len:254 (+) Transcript_72424:488-1249(+)
MKRIRVLSQQLHRLAVAAGLTSVKIQKLAEHLEFCWPRSVKGPRPLSWKMKHRTPTALGRHCHHHLLLRLLHRLRAPLLDPLTGHLQLQLQKTRPRGQLRRRLTPQRRRASPSASSVMSGSIWRKRGRAWTRLTRPASYAGMLLYQSQQSPDPSRRKVKLLEVFSRLMHLWKTSTRRRLRKRQKRKQRLRPQLLRQQLQKNGPRPRRRLQLLKRWLLAASLRGLLSCQSLACQRLSPIVWNPSDLCRLKQRIW